MAEPQTATAELAQFRVCDNCRVKKIRCDMTRPSCSACQLRRNPCTYSKRKRKPGPPKGDTRKRRAPDTCGQCNRPAAEHRPDETCLTESASPFDQRLSSEANSSRQMDRRTRGTGLTDDSAAMRWPHISLVDFSSYYTNISATQDLTATLTPDVEQYLFDLYFEHVQPLYPLFRRPQPHQTFSGSRLSPRLKMAIFSVSSRYANRNAVTSLPTPAEFAKQAQSYGFVKDLDMDEVKTSLLLCVHYLSESIDWHSLAEIGRLSRMAYLCGSYHPELQGDGSLSTGGASGSNDMEEWRSIWWCIFSLDTSCSAISITPPAFELRSQKTALPVESVPDFTYSSPSESGSEDLQYLPSGTSKYWETMSKLFQKGNCRSRNLHLATCTLMRSVTELRCLVKQDRKDCVRSRLRALESDYAAARLALPTWYFTAARSFSSAETEREHQDRLDTLLVSSCACLLISITTAQVADADQAHDMQLYHDLWQSIFAKANEIVLIVQNWKPSYFSSMDPLCSHIVFLAAAVLALDRAMLTALETSTSSTTGDFDLLMLFLRQVGSYWSVGNHLADSLINLQNLAGVGATYRDVTIFLWQLTSSGGNTCVNESNDSELNNRYLNLAASTGAGESPNNGQDDTLRDIDVSGMDWLDDILSGTLESGVDGDLVM